MDVLNISRTRSKNDCLIYIPDDRNSRSIKIREEKGMVEAIKYIKPYESLNNIAIKNEVLNNEVADGRDINMINEEAEYTTVFEYLTYDVENIIWENKKEFGENKEQESEFLLILTNINKFDQVKDMEMCSVIYNEIKIKTVEGKNSRSNFKFKLDGQNKEFKNIVIGLIFGLIILPDGCEVCIVIKENWIGQIKSFLLEESKRKELDHELYLFLKCLEQVILEKQLNIMFLTESKYEDEDYKIKMEAMKKELNDVYTNLSRMKLKDNNFIIDEFNLNGIIL